MNVSEWLGSIPLFTWKFKIEEEEENSSGGNATKVYSNQTCTFKQMVDPENLGSRRIKSKAFCILIHFAGASVDMISVAWIPMPLLSRENTSPSCEWLKVWYCQVLSNFHWKSRRNRLTRSMEDRSLLRVGDHDGILTDHRNAHLKQKELKHLP